MRCSTLDRVRSPLGSAEEAASSSMRRWTRRGSVLAGRWCPSSGWPGRPPLAVGMVCAALVIVAAPATAAPTPDELAASVLPLIAPVEALSTAGTVRPLARPPRGGRTAVPSDVLFAFGRAEVRGEGRRSLARLAASLARRPGTLRVIGHTDGVGRAADNRALSRRRAAAVVAVLRPALATSVRLVASGRGAADPVADERTPTGDDDPDGRARNRRVELRFVGR